MTQNNRKTYVADIPRLMEEWLWDRNQEFSPYEVTIGSGKKVWWKCVRGHEWDDTVLHRSQGRNCPYCSNHRILLGMNNLFATNPELSAEWDYQRNTDIDPDSVTSGSHARVWWKCSREHSYQSVIRERVKGDGCPYCSNKKIMSGYNDLQTLNPDIASEWNYEKNSTLGPQDVGAGSIIKVWWRCEKGHEWPATVVHRTRGNGCPYCRNRKVLPGYNDLATVHPELALEWNYLRNGKLRPEHCLPASGKRVWWICSKGHEWESPILSRHQGHNCSLCANQQVEKGYNDLATTNPIIAEEWHPTKNGSLTPYDVVAGTPKKVWWLGPCGHEWIAQVNNRNNGQGCSICAKGSRISFQEKSVYYYVQKYFPDAFENARLPYLDSLELDIYIPSLKIGIEYDGSHWHTDLQRDLYKDNLCHNNGIQLYRIREKECPFYSRKTWIYLKDRSQDTLSLAIIQLLSMLRNMDSSVIDVNVHRDRIEILQLVYLGKKETSIATLYPEVAAQWHPSRNGKLAASFFSPGSGKSVWWLGECGHEWEATIHSRIVGGGCPYCSNQRLLKGYNDLETTHPELLCEWDWERNGTLLPSDVFAGSEIMVWWKCSKGHSWQNYPYRRKAGAGCPICSNHQVLMGYNDLHTTHPQLSLEWNYRKNGELTPDMVVAGSNYRVWWKCSKCGHEWQTTVTARSKGAGCKKCANDQLGEKLSKSKLRNNGSLKERFPDLAEEWLFEKNNGLTPEVVTARNNMKVWWKCKCCGHEWPASINNRSKGHGCPACAKIRVLRLKRQTELSRRGSLQQNNPDIASEWDFEKNPCGPDEVFSNTRTDFWWICSKGHHYEASPNNRMHGKGCPYCSNRRVLPGYNDIGATHPQVLSDWDYMKNAEIKPDSVTAGSDKETTTFS